LDIIRKKIEIGDRKRKRTGNQVNRESGRRLSGYRENRGEKEN
jgi:hypothetical protein